MRGPRTEAPCAVRPTRSQPEELSGGVLGATYVLPLRWRSDEGLDDLAEYLHETSRLLDEVIVVDGSERELFERHSAAFGGAVRHIRPAPLGSAMGKVDGVLTGVREARHDAVVIADDDVRYDEDALRRTVAMLEEADLVRPQNYFDPLVWHARFDTGRSLLNRCFSGDLSDPAADFPGTLGVRRAKFTAMGGYDGDAMFENLELIRTVRAAGGIGPQPARPLCRQAAARDAALSLAACPAGL